jgi:hypothetical protein
MDSVPAPVIANFFIEDFKEVALNRVAYKPIIWFCNVDDTFMINFLNHHNIQFTMENETVRQPPSLPVDSHVQETRWFLGSHYIKETHTNLCVNVIQHHHIADKHSVLSTFIHRSHLQQQGCLPGELEFLHIIFKQNSYSDRHINCALKPPEREPSSTISTGCYQDIT